MTAASEQDLNTIANDTAFQGRCLVALEAAAINVMSESNNTAQHEARTNYAKQVINRAVSGLAVAAAVLTNLTIDGEASIAAGSPGYAVPDSDIAFTISSIYNALAGIGS